MKAGTIARVSVVALCSLFAFGGGGGCSRNSQQGVAFSKFDSLQVVKGQTTEQELIAQLGEPATTAHGAGGVKNMSWYATERERTNLPFGVGPNDRVQNRTFSVTTRNGVVWDFTEKRTQH